jgi:hypothetical protein
MAKPSFLQKERGIKPPAFWNFYWPMLVNHHRFHDVFFVLPAKSLSFHGKTRGGPKKIAKLLQKKTNQL